MQGTTVPYILDPSSTPHKLSRSQLQREQGLKGPNAEVHKHCSPPYEAWSYARASSRVDTRSFQPESPDTVTLPSHPGPMDGLHAAVRYCRRIALHCIARSTPPHADLQAWHPRGLMLRSHWPGASAEAERAKSLISSSTSPVCVQRRLAQPAASSVTASSLYTSFSVLSFLSTRCQSGKLVPIVLLVFLKMPVPISQDTFLLSCCLRTSGLSTPPARFPRRASFQDSKTSKTDLFLGLTFSKSNRIGLSGSQVN